MKLRKTRLWLCLPPSVFCLLDVCLTLQGQTREYWAGNLTDVNEGNLLGYWLLRQGPWVFALGTLIGWLGLVDVLILSLPRFWAAMLAFFVCFPHYLGACTWLYTRGWPGWIGIVLLLVATERILTLSWRGAKLGVRKRPRATRFRHETLETKGTLKTD